MPPQLVAVLSVGVILLALGVWARFGTGPARAWARGPHNYIEERAALAFAPGFGLTLALAAFLPLVGVGTPGYLPLITVVALAGLVTLVLLLVPRLPRFLVPGWARQPDRTHSMRTR